MVQCDIEGKNYPFSAAINLCIFPWKSWGKNKPTGNNLKCARVYKTIFYVYK